MMEPGHPQWPTLASLYLEPIGPGGQVLAGATGFLIQARDGYALVTARHVVTGLHEETKKPLDEKFLATPTRLRVWHPSNNWYAAADPVVLDLQDEDGEPRYLQDPSLIDMETADLTVLPFPIDDRGRTVRAYEVDPDQPLPEVASTVWIIGYPQRTRLHESDLAVWSRGSVASDPAQGWHGERFLIDSRTRKGQSGAPVVQYVPAHVTTSPDGQAQHVHPASWTLLGVYSGRLSEDSDLGSVWTPRVLAQTAGLY